MGGRRVLVTAQWYALAAASAPRCLPARHPPYRNALVLATPDAVPRAVSSTLMQLRTFHVSSPALALLPCSPPGGSSSSNTRSSNTASSAKAVAPPSSAKRSKKREPSPEELLVRRVNTLVGQRDAAAAVQAVKAALKGNADPATPPRTDTPTTGTRVGAAPSSPPGADATAERRPPVFSTKAFAAALFACEATGDAAAGLSLVDEVRRCASAGISAEWLSTEHVLSVVLRLQCAAGDAEGARRMFAYLDQRSLLRLRSAAAYLSFCCTQLQSRDLAMAVYEAALRNKIELTEPDYLALGRVCVRVGEPIRTLLYMLQEMREHVAEVSEAMVRDVLEPWVRLTRDDSRVAAVGGGAMAHVQLRRVDAMRLECAAPHASPSTAPSRSLSDPAAPSGDLGCQSGVCPACATELSGYPFTTACRAHLLRELTELVIPRACRSNRAKMGFEHWRRYIHARRDAGDRVDVFIDGANIGYYGLSSWYDLAKKALLLHRGVPESRITTNDLDFHAQCKASSHGVDVGVNFELIDSAVRLATETYGLRKPLVMLHERHVEPKFMTPESTAIVQCWRARGWLYCSPTGLNDDLCWLYGALLLTDPTDTVHSCSSTTTTTTTSAAPHRTLVCTNDKMRDHHFRLLSPRAFTRWRDRHRIAFRCARVESRTELHWTLPAPFERCIQRHDTQGAAPPLAAATSPTVTTVWHIPISVTEAPAEAELKEQGSAAEEELDETGDGALMSEVSATEVTPAKPGPWACLTVRRATPMAHASV